ncbi:unnamed protein product [Microthlaspi erraticum]|uniref:DUF4283 domain-containing protein n=1 Tax=Microthlaspi erraticum TaxID=1685480 RepID=A0A6D2KI23_9BRAS|nr:unnamed protein product [Microthlaspi erraticum]
MSEGVFFGEIAVLFFLSTFLFLRTVSRRDVVVEQFCSGSLTVSSKSVVVDMRLYDESCFIHNGHPDLYIHRLYIPQIHHILTRSISIFLLCYSKFNLYPKKMANNLRNAIQNLNLGINDEPVALPIDVCTEAVRVNQFSLIGRALIPRRQNLRAIVATLPRNWGLTGVISGRVIERRRFQFVFPSEDLMQSVLNRGPWSYGDRMLVLQQWRPEMDETDLNIIPFWVQVRGIPIQFLTRNVIYHIGDSLGHVNVIDFNPEMAAAVEFVRVKILLKECGLMTHDTGECIPNEEDDAPPPDNNDDDNGDDDNVNQMEAEHVHVPDPMIQQLEREALNQRRLEGEWGRGGILICRGVLTNPIYGEGSYTDPTVDRRSSDA